MKSSRYLDAFKAMKAECKDSFTLNGEALLVEEIPEEELKSRGGLILSTGNTKTKMVDGVEANKPCFVRVLSVGEGYYDDETKEPVALDVEPGDVVLVGKLSVQWFSAFGNIFTYEGSGRLGLTTESEIKLRFKGQDGYDKVFLTLNRELENKSA